MRGRKPSPPNRCRGDTPVLQAVARSRQLAWFQVQHARIVLAVAAGEPIQAVASRLECDRATVWRVCRRYEHGGLKDLLLDDPRVGTSAGDFPPPASPDRRTGLPGAGRRGAAHHPLDQRRTWPARPLPTASWTPSAHARSGESCTTWTCNRTAPATGGPPASTPGSRSGPRKCSGATPMRNGWPARASGPWPSMRCPTSRCWSGTRSGGQSPAPSSSRSSSTPGTARSTCCCSWSSTPGGWRSASKHEGRRALHRGVAGLSPPASWLEGGVPDPGRRPQPHGRRHGRLLVELPGLVAPRFTPAHASWLNQAELLVGAFGSSLPETGLVGQSGGVHRACVGLRTGVQPALRPPL